MEVKVRYLSRGIAKCFGSSGKVGTIHIPGGAKYGNLLGILENKLRHYGELDEGLLDMFVFICGGRMLLNIKDESLNPNYEVLIGYADTGG
ncbi:hypothetical protein KAU92_03850 [Candidatus Bathyarchaeota archaeon]|nr:hypothetical protein [Candidatus Bathyarchaeota archaeon]MCK4668510.1 hypothetical protein [Candidatus Bathyarchaeota archaeon]